MTATFHSLRDTRLPKATKAVELLGNLVRYSHTEQEAKDLVNVVNDAAEDLDAIFAKKWGWDAPDRGDAPTYAPHETLPPTKYSGTVPAGTAEGGASFESEVRWALDALKRGDKKLAEDRLARILKGESGA